LCDNPTFAEKLCVEFFKFRKYYAAHNSGLKIWLVSGFFEMAQLFNLKFCLSRRTLATILRNSTLKKQKMNDKKIKNIKSQKNAALLLIFGPLILLISYIGKTDFDKYGINNYVICLSLFVLIICGGIGLKNSLRKQKELNR